MKAYPDKSIDICKCKRQINRSIAKLATPPIMEILPDSFEPKLKGLTRDSWFFFKIWKEDVNTSI